MGAHPRDFAFIATLAAGLLALQPPDWYQILLPDPQPRPVNRAQRRAEPSRCCRRVRKVRRR